jgi:hypothetical protein
MNSKPIDFNINIYNVFAISNTRFCGKLTFSKFQEKQLIQFITKNNMLTSRKIIYGNITIPNVSRTKFFSLTDDNTLSWKNHNDLLINKLRTACYVFRSVKEHTSHSTMIMFHYCLFHSIMTYGIIFLCSFSHSKKIFKYKRSKLPLQIRTTAGNRNTLKQALRKFLTFILYIG